MKLKALFHINAGDEAVLTGALTNATNFLDEASPEKSDLCFVVHGPAVKFFRKGTEPDHSAWIEQLAGRGICFRVCRNALAGHQIPADELLDACQVVPSGVVELARLQAEGYAYVKP